MINCTVGRMLALSLLLGGLTACGGPPYTVAVTRAPSLSDHAIEVDLVAVGPTGEARLQNYEMSQYFNPNNRFRQDQDKYTIAFQPDGQATRELSADAEVWDRWLSRGATTLFILADLPGNFEDRPADQDPRRLMLPLSSSRWPWRTSTLPVTIQSSGLQAELNPGPAE